MRNQLLHIRKQMTRLLSEMQAQGMLDELKNILSALDDDLF